MVELNPSAVLVRFCGFRQAVWLGSRMVRKRRFGNDIKRNVGMNWMRVLFCASCGLAAFGTASGATLTLTTSDASGKSSFDTWNISGGGTESPSSDNDYVVKNGKYIRIQWSRTFGGNSLSFGEVGSSAGALIIQRGDSNAGHSIGFGNNGAILNRGYFTIWSQNRTPTLINEGPLVVKAPESEPFRIQLGDGQNTNNAMTISARVQGDAGTALMLCAGTKPQTDSFTLLGDISAFKGQLIVAGGREQGNRNFFPVRAVLSGALGGTLVVQPDAAIRTRYTDTVFTTAELSLEEDAVLVATCNNSGTSCGKIVVTERLSVAQGGAIVKLLNEPYWTTTNGFDEVVLTLPQEKGTIPLERFKLSIAEEKTLLNLATNLVDGIWQLVVHKEPHDLLSVNDSASASLNAGILSCCTNAASWYSGETPHAGRMYMANKGSGGLADYPIVRTPYYVSEPYVFAGDALVLGNGSRLLLCSRDTTFGLLALNANVTVPLALNGVPTFLRGTIRLRGSSETYPQVFQAYFQGLNTIAAEVVGPGTLHVTGRSGSGKPYGDIEFTALNTNFTGRIKVCSKVNNQAASEDSYRHERVFVTDARNLGGPLAAFKADALELADYSVLQPRNDVDLNVANRGVTITDNACFAVPEGVTLAVSNDITYNGELKKTGAGVLSLNGRARAGGSAASLKVAEGFLSVGSTNALDGVEVTFADGAYLLVNPKADGDVAACGAVDMSSAPFGGALPVAFLLPEPGEDDTCFYNAVAVCTVANQAAADSLAVTAKRIDGFRTTFSRRPNADGTVTILATVGPDGLSIIIR